MRAASTTTSTRQVTRCLCLCLCRCARSRLPTANSITAPRSSVPSTSFLASHVPTSPPDC
eukprot:409184-Rhodomonas_salina.5